MDEIDDDILLTGIDAASELAADPFQRRRLAAWAYQRYGFSQDEVDEVIQDTCVDLMRVRKLVRSREGLAFRIFKFRCGKRLRAQKRHPESTGHDAALAELAVSELPADARVLLREAFGAMSASCRQLLLALYVDGVAPQVLARTRGLASPRVVSTTASRCIRKLRERFREGRT